MQWIHSYQGQYRLMLALVCFISMAMSYSVKSYAGKADVLTVKVRALGGDRYHIDATVQHQDKGWDHYANAWQVLDTNGKVLGERVLHHPHDDEQPFTRSLTLRIPASVKDIVVQAKDNVHGYGGKAVTVVVPSS